MSNEILAKLEDAIVEMKADETGALTREAMQAGTPALDILNKGLLTALERVGVLFRDGDYFLPDVLMSVKAYKNAYALLDDELKKGSYKSRGTVMLGTVHGDIHEIGKNILLALLQGNGYTVVDIGVDVQSQVFVDKAKEFKPDIIGMSALLTTSMPAMKEVIDLFVKDGSRGSYKIIVGGAPVSHAFAKEIGADGYGEDAQSGVELVGKLLAS
jgi:5-methyltetrahydrofolate--homocysteine methyltransferase